MDEKRPSRRKDKDNPYTMIVKDGKFFVMFRNIDNESVTVERTSASSWWSGDSQSDPWEWRIALAGHPEVAYGKFFDKRAGFIHRDFFPIFANYRRNGYDFDALSDEGLVPHRAKRIMDVFELNDEAIGNEIMSNALKEKAGFGKEGGEKNFEGVLTELQMQTYLIVSDFRQRMLLYLWSPCSGNYRQSASVRWR